MTKSEQQSAYTDVLARFRKKVKRGPADDQVSQSPRAVILNVTSADLEFAREEGKKPPYVAPSLKLAAAWSWRGLVVLAGVAVVFWLLSKISLVVLAALIALLLAALLAPLAEFLISHKWPRGLAAGTVFVGFLLLVSGLLALVGQQLVSGFSALSDQVVVGFQTILTWLNSNPFGIDSAIIAGYLDDALNKVTSYLENSASSIASGAAGAATSVGNFATGLILALFSTFFFILDGKKIFAWLLRLLPKPAQEKSYDAAMAGWKTLVQYVRVQILVAGIDAIGIGIGAAFLGLPLVIPLTVLVFLGSFIPIVGALVTGVIAVLVALVAKGFWAAVIMLVVVLLVQQLEGNVLQPFIMGKAVSVHPLPVVLSVSAGTVLFGIVGALFAVPVISVANSVVLSLSGNRVFDDATPGIKPDEEEGSATELMVEQGQDGEEKEQ